MLVQGGPSRCGAFVANGLKRVVVQWFAGAVLGFFAWAWPPPARAMAVPYQATAPADEPDGLPRSADTIAFDIPPQSLLKALRAYGEFTGQAVLVDDTLAADRHSPGVRGNYDKTEALQRLLVGTGLVASYSSDQAFTLKLAGRGEAMNKAGRERPQGLGSGESEAVIEHYAGVIQKPIEAALCQSDEARPGTYRLALQLWIAASGRVERTRLLDPVDGRRNDEVRRSLNRLVLDPPPSGMPQPITLLLLPARDGDASACASDAPFLH